MKPFNKVVSIWWAKSYDLIWFNYMSIIHLQILFSVSWVSIIWNMTWNCSSNKQSILINRYVIIDERSKETCWKLLTVFPILRPTSGNFLGPKTRATTPAITTSSGTPSPNKQVQDKPFFFPLSRLDLFPWAMVKGLRVLVKKDELEEEKDKVFVDGEVRFMMDGV